MKNPKFDTSLGFFIVIHIVRSCSAAFGLIFILLHDF